jgi:hypothetical protein
MRSIGKECVSTVQTLALPFGEFPRQMLVSVTSDQPSVGDLGSGEAGQRSEFAVEEPVVGLEVGELGHAALKLA